MGDITRNFSREEFACKCGCGMDEISNTTVLVLQSARDYFGKTINVTSGCRCDVHNKNVGGVKGSQHTIQDCRKTFAADIQIDGIEPFEVYKYIDETFPNSLGLGIYKTFVHVDCRMDRAYRWDKR